MNVIQSTLTLCIATLVVSCGALKPAANLTQNSTTAAGTEKSNINFLAVKEIKNQPVKTVMSSAYVTTAEVVDETTSAKGEVASSSYIANAASIGVSNLQIKYAEKLAVEPALLTNIALYKAVDNWYGTRYRFGGMSHRGVDCSSLMQHLYEETYGMSIPRTAVTQYRATKRITRDELKEGDLIFFHTTRAGISHVGMYLGNGRFVHASSSKGVTINHIDENYYASRARGYGRFEKETVAETGMGQ